MSSTIAAVAPETDAKKFASEYLAETYLNSRIKGLLTAGLPEGEGLHIPIKGLAAFNCIDFQNTVRQMGDYDLFTWGEKALKDVADDIIVLDEIRNRFLARKNQKAPILGYTSWGDFVDRNSRFSIRTIQKRLAEVHGKDESKVNLTTGNMYTRAADQQTADHKPETAAPAKGPNTFRAAQEQNAINREARTKSAVVDLAFRLDALLPANCDGSEHTFVQCMADAFNDVHEGTDARLLATLDQVIASLSEYRAKFASRSANVQLIKDRMARQATRNESCQAWVTAQLTNGPENKRDVESGAESAGFSIDEVRQAVAALGVTVTQLKDKPMVWTLKASA